MIMAEGYVDSPERVDEMINFSRENGVEELTFRSVSKPDRSLDEEAWQWVKDREITQEVMEDISSHLFDIGKEEERFPWGAVVFDVDGQNVCLTNCLTGYEAGEGNFRQLIFYPDGKIATGWTDEAELL